MTIRRLLLALCVVGLASPAAANTFYKAGFEMKLKGKAAELGFRDAVQVGNLVVAQVGGAYLTAVNDQSGTERWRFESPTGSIRKIHDRHGWLLVEAENLVALDAATGKERWSVPLNCYSAKRCNTRVRHISRQAIVLSGYDGRDDQLMLLSGEDGTQLWPNWVDLTGVSTAKHFAYTPDTLVVAGGEAPFAVVGLDRYTGRERWRFRPPGTDQAAAGLLADDTVVTTWWRSRTADEVYTLDLKTGKARSDWMVGRRASSLDEMRAGGPGYFYAYQRSVLGGGGTARAWNTRTGDPLWRKRIEVEFAPVVRSGSVFVWATKRDRASFVSYSSLTGEEVWRYDRRGVDGHDETYQGPLVLIRIVGKVPFVNVLMASSGKVLGIARLEDESLYTAILRFSNNRLFALSAGRLVRFEPTRSEDLVFRFNQLIEDARYDEAQALHRLLRPFVDELEAAREIHNRVASRQFRQESASMKQGSLAALLPVLERRSRDSELVYYQDFRTFVINVRELLKPHDLTHQLKGRDLKRLATISDRLIKVMIRFERKLDDRDKELIGALLSIIEDISRLLLVSGRVSAAHDAVWEIYSRAWVDRSESLTSLTRKTVAGLIQPFMSKLERAVLSGKGAGDVIKKLLAIKGIALIAPSLSGATDPSGMTADEQEALLRVLRAGLKTH